ncbi:MAG: hypothetical protein ACFFER_15875 [Candidatus Thorarchaeota archaeon]
MDEAVLCGIDVYNINGEVVEVPITTIPTLKIWDGTLNGLPDESSEGEGLPRMVIKECFYDSQKGE